MFSRNPLRSARQLRRRKRSQGNASGSSSNGTGSSSSTGSTAGAPSGGQSSGTGTTGAPQNVGRAPKRCTARPATGVVKIDGRNIRRGVKTGGQDVENLYTPPGRASCDMPRTLISRCYCPVGTFHADNFGDGAERGYARDDRVVSARFDAPAGRGIFGGSHA